MSDHDETGFRPAAHRWHLVDELIHAVERGDALAVAALLRAGADREAVTELEGPTVLMLAAEAGNLDVVRALVEGGANVDAEADEGDLYRFLDEDELDVFQSGVSALLYADLKGHRAVYDYLYPLTDPDLQREVERASEALRRYRESAQGDPPRALLKAARNGSADEVRALLDAGVDPNALDVRRNSALWEAVAFRPQGGDGVLAVVDLLLAAGADPNIRNALGDTPLSIAAVRPAPDLLRVLIEAGADPSVAGFQGMTPLIGAAESGLAENVSVLVAAGAALRARDARGGTAYGYARWCKHQAVVDLLGDAGAVRESTQQLVDAAAGGRIDRVERLIAAGADVRDYAKPEPDLELTALHAAARAGHGAVARALVTAGGEVEARTWHFVDRAGRGLTPLLYAATGGHAAVIRVLLEAGAKPDTTSAFLPYETPLLYAATLGHAEAVRVLLDAGADPRRISGVDGLDALGRAGRKGHREVDALLRNATPGAVDAGRASCPPT
jgi:ankyrin repeat protein